MTEVPAHAGGVDLSCINEIRARLGEVPDHAGGVDLSIINKDGVPTIACPRPCGRGGFKQNEATDLEARIRSPPMRAGWI